MKKQYSAAIWSAVIALAILIADQVLKFWVKTHFYLGEDLELTSWFHLKFIENNGMAFGMELFSKILLTLGRIAAVVFLVWIIVKLCADKTRKFRTGFIIALGMIAAGALGNIIDCVFYGEIFSNPAPPEVAVLFPEGGGYAPWFEGRVVDMLYFPLFSFTWPAWVPGVGGQEYEFFQYIFNIADSAICVGVALLVIFFSKDVSEAWNMFTAKKDPKEK